MRNLSLIAGLAALAIAGSLPVTSIAQEDDWSLMTATPEEGFALAVQLARKAVTTIQTDKEVLVPLRPAYANDPAMLIDAAEVVGVYFDTVAAANDYWRTD
ncbi:MAG: hexameric tyrosine-coordinated heme protein [Pseudomonadota bacterium]